MASAPPLPPSPVMYAMKGTCSRAISRRFARWLPPGRALPRPVRDTRRRLNERDDRPPATSRQTSLPASLCDSLPDLADRSCGRRAALCRGPSAFRAPAPARRERAMPQTMAASSPKARSPWISLKSGKSLDVIQWIRTLRMARQFGPLPGVIPDIWRRRASTRSCSPCNWLGRLVFSGHALQLLYLLSIFQSSCAFEAASILGSFRLVAAQYTLRRVHPEVQRGQHSGFAGVSWVSSGHHFG